jgi:hypothetical protein
MSAASFLGFANRGVLMYSEFPITRATRFPCASEGLAAVNTNTMIQTI